MQALRIGFFLSIVFAVLFGKAAQASLRQAAGRHLDDLGQPDCRRKRTHLLRQRRQEFCNPQQPAIRTAGRQ